MRHVKDTARTRYAAALCAAAIAATLSACAQTDPAPEASATSVGSAKASSDMPEVVIVASRTQSDSTG